jgi:Cu+-exporting ATPase
MQNSNTAIDPVCGMTVDKAAPAATTAIGGETWHFCSTYCKARFDGDPESFIEPRQEPQESSCSRSNHCCR